MYCKKCGVFIDCYADKCPLCGEKTDCTEKERAYPVPRVSRRRADIVSKVFFWVAVVVSVACVIANILTEYHFMWSIMVIVVSCYIYYCLRFNFLIQKKFTAIVVGQAVALTAVFAAIRIIVGANHFIFITWLPIVYFVSVLLLLGYLIINRKEAKKKMMTLIVMGVMGVIPIVTAYVLDLSVKWPSIAASAISIALIPATLIVGRKHVLDQLKRYFHR